MTRQIKLINPVVILAQKTVNTKLEIEPSMGEYNEDNTQRCSVELIWDSTNEEKIAVAIGINPSEADGNIDDTMVKLSRYLDSYGFTKVIMLNLFKSISTDKNQIDITTATDFSDPYYQNFFKKADAIVIVWSVDDNEYKTEKNNALNNLKGYEDKLCCILNNNSYPMHPSRMSYNWDLVKCSIGNLFII